MRRSLSDIRTPGEMLLDTINLGNGRMKVKQYGFGELKIDSDIYVQDIEIARRQIKKRKKKKSKPYRERFGHTPLSIDENIPWSCKTLVVGRGMCKSLPVMNEVISEAKRRGVTLIMVNTEQALQYINKKDTNLILHLTC